jgi:hypothetical protein
MWRSLALVIAAHGMPKKHGIAHRLACGQADQVTQVLGKTEDWPIGKPTEDRSGASGGTALHLELLL